MLHLLKKIRKSSYVMAAILALVFFANVMFTTTTEKSAGVAAHTGREKYAGSASCAGCHKEIYESHIKTAHFLDSRPADKKFIKGSFEEGKNIFVYNKFMYVKLTEENDSLFQTAHLNGVAYQSAPFDMVIGSGRKGQSYLYWQNDQLFQLPVSYYTPLNSWCNSPGFSNNFIKFDRIIPAQCLECHGTYAAAALNEDKEPVYEKNSIIYGIDCERCHGPAAEHVAYQTANPKDTFGKYIINIKNLNRLQRLDACALCHSGFRNEIQPAFSFKTGDTLDHFSTARYSDESTAGLDVHGNQYGLLTSSKCFKMSQLDCSSCHNVHQNEADAPAIFSQRCITCHQDVKHSSLTLSAGEKDIIQSNCIDCHMPVMASKKIILNVSDANKAVPDLIRSHRVAIYDDATDAFLKKIKKGK